MTAQCVPLLYFTPVRLLATGVIVGHEHCKVGYEFVTDAEIAHDLRPLSDRAETTYEKSTAIQTGDKFEVRQRMLRAAGRKMRK